VTSIKPGFQFAFVKGLILFMQQAFPLAAAGDREGIAQ
jgi:hypothetical protein